MWSILFWLFFCIIALSFFLVLLLQILLNRVTPLKLKHRTVLITGGSIGLGRVLAHKLVEQGAYVVIASRRDSLIQQTLEELRELTEDPGDVCGVTMSVDQPKSVQLGLQAVKEWAHQLEHGSGHVDIVICNAGFVYPTLFEELPRDKEDAMIKTNIHGSFSLVRELLLPMKRAGFGRFIFVSSEAVWLPISGFSVYSAAKVCLRMFALVLNQELTGSGVRFQVVYPPDMFTPGYTEENKVKSAECRAICDFWSSPVPPEDIADIMVNALRHYRFDVTIGFMGWLLSVAGRGSEPWNLRRPLDFAEQLLMVLISPICRLLIIALQLINVLIVRYTRSTKGATGSPTTMHAS